MNLNIITTYIINFHIKIIFILGVSLFNSPNYLVQSCGYSNISNYNPGLISNSFTQAKQTCEVKSIISTTINLISNFNNCVNLTSINSVGDQMNGEANYYMSFSCYQSSNPSIYCNSTTVTQYFSGMGLTLSQMNNLVDGYEGYSSYINSGCSDGGSIYTGMLFDARNPNSSVMFNYLSTIYDLSKIKRYITGFQVVNNPMNYVDWVSKNGYFFIPQNCTNNMNYLICENLLITNYNSANPTNEQSLISLLSVTIIYVFLIYYV